MNEELHYALDLSRQGYKTAAMGIIADVLKRDPEDVEAWATLAQIVEDKDQKRDSLNRILLLTKEDSMRTWANEQLALLDQPAEAAEIPPPAAEPAESTPTVEPAESTPDVKTEADEWLQMLDDMAGESEAESEPEPEEASPLSGQTEADRPDLGADEWSELVQSWGTAGAVASEPAEDEPEEDSWSQMLDDMAEEPEAESEPETETEPQPEPEPETEPQPTKDELDEWGKLLDESTPDDDGLTARSTSDELPGGSDWIDLLGDSTPQAEETEAEAESEPAELEDEGEWSKFLDGLSGEEADEDEEDEDEWTAMLEDLAADQKVRDEADKVEQELIEEAPVEEEPVEEAPTADIAIEDEEPEEEVPVVEALVEEEPEEEVSVEEELVDEKPVIEPLVIEVPAVEEPVREVLVIEEPTEEPPSEEDYDFFEDKFFEEEADITPIQPRSELPIFDKKAEPEAEESTPPGDKWDEMLTAWGEEPLGETQANQRTDAIRRTDIDQVLETPPPGFMTDDMDTPPIPEPAPEIPQVKELESWAEEQPRTYTVEPSQAELAKKDVDEMIAARLQGIKAEVEKEKEEDKAEVEETAAAPAVKAEIEEPEEEEEKERRRSSGCLRLMLVVLGGLILGAALMFGLFWLAQTNPDTVKAIPLVGEVLVPSEAAPEPTPTGIAEETPAAAAQAEEPSPTVEIPPSLTPTIVPTEASTPEAPPTDIPTVAPSPVLPTPTAIPYGENIFVPPSTTSLAVQQIDGFDPDFGRVVLLRDNLILVGGPFEDAEGTDGASYADAGKVYILQRRGENWAAGVDMMALPSPDPADDQGFGSAIAFDGETLAVGTRTGDAVYLLQQDGESWESIATLTGSGGFGQSVAFDGETLVIGAPEADNSTGAVYIYAQNNDTWVEVQELTADDPAEGDRFGQAVAVDGNTIAIGALGAGEALPTAPGAVYVYQLEDETWEQKTRITVTNDGSFESFGWPLDISGGIIVAGTRARSFPELPGQAFIFEDTSAPGDWEGYIETRLPAPSILGEAQFGTAVATDGEMVAIGAVGLAPSIPGLNPGRLIIYERREGTWAVREVLTAPTVADTAEFPLAVDIQGLVAVTGAPLLEEGDTGSVIIFELPPE